ncbi:MAG: LysR family transcriptional regulator [Bulleidia sp.]
MPTRHALELFVCVYETGSVTQTANRFYCTQPSVSRTIRDLESEYSLTLFERYHHKLIPTPSAKLLYEYAMRIIQTYTEMDKAMENGKQMIRIGSTVTISNTVLTSLLKKYQSMYPDIRTEITVNNGAFLQDALIGDDIDLALIEDSIHFDDLQAVPFDSDSLVLIVPTDHPLASKNQISLQDLNGIPYLKRDRGSAVREYVDHLFAERGIVVDSLWESTSTHALIHAVEEGFGVTILPYRMCCREIEENRVKSVTITDAPLQRTCYVVTHRQKILSGSIRQFLALLQKNDA